MTVKRRKQPREKETRLRREERRKGSQLFRVPASEKGGKRILGDQKGRLDANHRGGGEGICRSKKKENPDFYGGEKEKKKHLYGEASSRRGLERGHAKKKSNVPSSKKKEFSANPARRGRQTDQTNRRAAEEGGTTSTFRKGQSFLEKGKKPVPQSEVQIILRRRRGKGILLPPRKSLNYLRKEWKKTYRTSSRRIVV